MLLTPLGSVKILFVFLVLQTRCLPALGHFSSLIPMARIRGWNGALGSTTQRLGQRC